MVLCDLGLVDLNRIAVARVERSPHGGNAFRCMHFGAFRSTKRDEDKGTARRRKQPFDSLSESDTLAP